MVHPQRPFSCGSQTALAKQAYSIRHSQVLKSGWDAQSWLEQPLMTQGATARDELVPTDADGRSCPASPLEPPSAGTVTQAQALVSVSTVSKRMSFLIPELTRPVSSGRTLKGGTSRPPPRRRFMCRGRDR